MKFPVCEWTGSDCLSTHKGLCLKGPIHSLTQSDGLMSCYGEPVVGTSEIVYLWIYLIGLRHWFPIATDWIVGLSLKVDQGLQIGQNE